MKLSIDKRYEEPLLAREKIVAALEFENAIPARNDVIHELAKKINARPELMVVSSITPLFGSRKADVTAYAYKSKEDMMKALAEKMIVKTGLQKKKEVKEEKPAVNVQAEKIPEIKAQEQSPALKEKKAKA